MDNKKMCTLCTKFIVGKEFLCDVCKKSFCSKCERFLSVTHTGRMNVGKVCPECLNKNQNLRVIDPDNPRYYG